VGFGQEIGESIWHTLLENTVLLKGEVRVGGGGEGKKTVKKSFEEKPGP